MIYILHGDNINESRKTLTDLIKKHQGEVVTLDGKTLDPTAFLQATQSDSMFGSSRLVVIENYLSGKKDLDLNLNDTSAGIVFWESKLLTPASVTKLSRTGAHIQEFKIPTLVFKLCDGLRPKNGKILILMFNEVLKVSEPEFIFAMFIRQFRLMLDPTDTQPWQRKNIESQAKLFGEERLKIIYNELLEIDCKNKTGGLIGSFEENLRMFLLWI